MRVKGIGRWALLTTTMLGLSACATQPPLAGPSADEVWAGVNRDAIQSQLTAATNRAADALETLAMIERTRTEPQPSPIDERILPEDLRRSTTVNWSGPANNLVQQLAQNLGYSYTEFGNPPPTPLMVSVSLTDVAAVRAFEDIGLQIQPYARVVLDPNQQRIEFRHDGEETRHMAPQPAEKKPRAQRPLRTRTETVRKPVDADSPAQKDTAPARLSDVVSK